jgi:hypothetical protein
MALSPCRFCAHQAEEIGMQEQTTRTTDAYKLKPTPEQAAAMSEVVVPCRRLDHVAPEQRWT